MNSLVDLSGSTLALELPAIRKDRLGKDHDRRAEFGAESVNGYFSSGHAKIDHLRPAKSGSFQIPGSIHFRRPMLNIAFVILDIEVQLRMRIGPGVLHHHSLHGDKFRKVIRYRGPMMR